MGPRSPRRPPHRFLGYHFDPEGLRVATTTLANFILLLRQLYEHAPGGAAAASRLGVYVRRWVRWVHAGPPATPPVAMPGVPHGGG